MARTEQEFDDIHNEGGEGYNPIRADRLAREDAARAAEPVTLDDLYRRLERLDGSLVREAGIDNSAEIATVRAQIAAIKAAEAEKFLAAWPRELTIARRAEWNAWARANATPRGIPTRRAMDKLREMGVDDLNDLRRAVKVHNL